MWETWQGLVAPVRTASHRASLSSQLEQIRQGEAGPSSRVDAGPRGAGPSSGAEAGPGEGTQWATQAQDSSLFGQMAAAHATQGTVFTTLSCAARSPS